MNRQAIALAACSFAVSADPATPTQIRIQVTPAGNFLPSDGREIGVPSWHIDAALASRLIDRFNARKTPPVIDYEHQTLNKEENGQPAPAAGFITSLDWQEGQGLFASAELTSRAAQYIADGEYRYFSPVFSYDEKNGDVLQLLMGALTNFPGLDDLPRLGSIAAATFKLNGESAMTLLNAVCTALGLPDTTTEAQAITALTAQQQQVKSLRDTLGTDDLVAACTSLKAASSKKPDPSQYVPTTVMDQLKGEVAALTARLVEKDAADLDVMIKGALADGRLLPAQEVWARDLGKNNLASLTAYLGNAAPIAALTRTQTGGQPPAVTDEKTGLTATELAICTAMGLPHEQYKAAKAEETAQ